MLGGPTPPKQPDRFFQFLLMTLLNLMVNIVTSPVFQKLIAHTCSGTVRADYYGGDEGRVGCPCLLVPNHLQPAAEEILTNQRAISRKKRTEEDSEKKKTVRALTVLPLPPEHDPSGKPGHKISRRSALQEIAQKILKSGSIQPR